jgi:hypothetical protein
MNRKHICMSTYAEITSSHLRHFTGLVLVIAYGQSLATV